MWNKTKSLFLSRTLSAAAAIIILLMVFFVPAVSSWYEDAAVGYGVFDKTSIYLPMCICLYFCEAMALAAMWSLNVLLGNINKGEVFTAKNTSCLRRISWECIFAGLALLVLGLWRFVFVFGALLAIMFGLIMRVLKNVFEKAVEIKSENDFTV